MNKKVAITGGTGFVGQNLVKYFAGKNNFQIVLLNLRMPITDEMLSNVDCVIHLAGKAHDFLSPDNYQEYFHVNTELTKKIFERFLSSNSRDFIYLSSVKAVCDSFDGVLDETFIGKPLTSYGRSKKEAEEYLQSIQLPLSKRLFILRPCMIHGPMNKGNLNLLYKFVNRGIPYPLASFSNKRSFLSIANLCYIVEMLLTRNDIETGIYHLADDQPLSTNEVIRIIAEKSGKRVRLWKLAPIVVRFLAKIGDILSLSLNSERLKKMTENYIVSNNKIKKAIGVSNLPTSSKDGLRTTIESFASRE